MQKNRPSIPIVRRGVRSRLLNKPFVQQHRTPESCGFDALLVAIGAGEYVASQQTIIAFGEPQFQSCRNVKDGARQQPATWPDDVEERRPVAAFRQR